MNVRHLLAPLFSVRLLLPFIVFISGCSTTTPSATTKPNAKTNHFAITIEDDLEQAPAFPGKMKYVLYYGDGISEQLIEPHSKQLHAILGQLGYEPAQLSDAAVIIYVVVSKDQLVTTTRQITMRDAVGTMNIDSIRYKNVAAMMPGTRYQQLLSNNPNEPGEIILGPSGEFIHTGDMRRQQLDQIERDLPKINEVRRINQLIVSALELPIPDNPDEAKIPWQVRVLSDLPPDKPSPDTLDLIEAALDRLLDQHPEASSAEP